MSPTQFEKILKDVPFLDGLEQKHLAFIAGGAREAKFPAGSFLIHAGETADRLFIVTKGLVGIELFAVTAGPISVQTVLPGEILGWSWLIPPHYWRFDAIAIEPTEVIEIDGVRLREQCEKDHSLGFLLSKRVAQIFSGRLESARHQLLKSYKKRALEGIPLPTPQK